MTQDRQTAKYIVVSKHTYKPMVLLPFGVLFVYIVSRLKNNYARIRYTR